MLKHISHFRLADVMRTRIEQAYEGNWNKDELIIVKLENDPAYLSWTVFEVLKDEDDSSVKGCVLKSSIIFKSSTILSY